MQRDYNGYSYNAIFNQIFFFSHKSSKKKEKEAGTNFPLLSRSRNMIGWFIKTSLHKPIKILQFLSHGEIQKCLT